MSDGVPWAIPLPQVTLNLRDLEQQLGAREAAQAGIRKDNHARIVWADPARPRRTNYAMVYLHGFTASQGEGEPQHRRLARDIGGNLYLPRLPGHGLYAADAMRGIRAQDWIDAAAEALAIGLALGDRVVLAGTSLGASLGLLQAAAQAQAVAAVLAWSPGIRPYDAAALQKVCALGDVVLPRPLDAHPAERRHYVSDAVHADGYRGLAELFYGKMQPPTFARIVAPLYMACFYRDENHQDTSASVAAMQAMFEAVGTPPEWKRQQVFADAAHVIASPWRSAAAEQVYLGSRDFLWDVL